jgi:hypothetical protein
MQREGLVKLRTGCSQMKVQPKQCHSIGLESAWQITGVAQDGSKD